MVNKQVAINKGGRPVEFTPELKVFLLDRLAEGATNAEACAAAGITRETLHRAVASDAAFREAYDVAKRLSVDALLDKADDLADRATRAASGAEVAGCKVAIDHYWRKAARIAPHRWGERPTVVAVVEHQMDEQMLAKRLVFLQRLAAPEIED